jgi:glucosamine--fructose-6-phosphate aminotransferase (isomerizing)
VAATKSFTAQLAVLYSVAQRLAPAGTPVEESNLLAAIDSVLDSYSAISRIARDLNNVNDIYLLGKFLHYPIALEGALKLKELAYVHAEGIAAGELKHGPLALMDKGTVVMLLNPSDNTYADTLASAHEMKARGARIVGISDKRDDLYDHWVPLPKVDDMLYPLIEVIPLQFLAYFMSVNKKVDPDYPRNLAKSVTVR